MRCGWWGFLAWWGLVDFRRGLVTYLLQVEPSRPTDNPVAALGYWRGSVGQLSSFFPRLREPLTGNIMPDGTAASQSNDLGGHPKSGQSWTGQNRPVARAGIMFI